MKQFALTALLPICFCVLLSGCCGVAGTSSRSPTLDVVAMALEIKKTQLASARATAAADPWPGIGVSRQQVQSVFEGKLGYRFEIVEDRDGYPAVSGKPADYSVAFMYLVGPPQQLVKASITISLNKDKPAEGALNGMRALTLLRVVAPEWKEGSDWVIGNASVATKGGNAVTFYRNLRVEMSSHIRGMVTLSFTGR